MLTNKTLDSEIINASIERKALAFFADNTSQFVFWKDRDSVYQGCNENFAKYAGLSNKELIVGKTDYDLPWSTEEADFFRKIDQEVMDSGESQLNFEEPQTLASGEKRWLKTSKSPLYDNDGEVIGIVGWYSDIAASKKLQLQIDEKTQAIFDYNLKLETANIALEMANLDLEKFTSAASHDLKSPIRSIMSFAQLLNHKKTNEYDEESMEYLGYIISYAKRMDILVHDILAYAKSGTKNAKPKQVDLSKVIANKLLDLQQIVKIKGAKIDVNLPTAPITCVPELLGMVFYNLINNGLKFNKSEEPHIVVDYSETDQYWVFSVQDNGIGIDSKYDKKLYEPFSRMVGTDFEGSGIGLSICKRVSNIHKGEVWRTDNPEGGSIFHFSISKSLE